MTSAADRDVVPAWSQVPTVPAALPVGPSFVGVDVETANSARGSICAIGATVVRDGLIAENHSWLCRPPAGLDRFDPGNMLIHGITPDHVADAPPFRQRFTDLLAVVGNLPVVAHNAEFDMSALREAAAAEGIAWGPIDYGCTLEWSRHQLSGLANYKLPTVARALNVPLDQHHDASADAAAAAGIALALITRSGTVSVEDFTAATGLSLRKSTYRQNASRSASPGSRGAVPTWVAVHTNAATPEPSREADPAHPLFGQTVVITGALSGMSKDEAWSLLAKCGATVRKTVTRKTSVVVVGTWLDEQGRPAITDKHSEARRLQQAGQNLVIIDQQQMEALLAGDQSIPVPDPAARVEVDAYALADDSLIAPNNAADPRQQVRGKHFTAWVEPVKQLKRDGRLDEALDLLLECIVVVERPDVCGGGAPAPGYTEQAAIVYRKKKDFAGEIAILQRWIDAARRAGHTVSPDDPFAARIAKARALQDKQAR